MHRRRFFTTLAALIPIPFIANKIQAKEHSEPSNLELYTVTGRYANKVGFYAFILETGALYITYHLIGGMDGVDPEEVKVIEKQYIPDFIRHLGDEYRDDKLVSLQITHRLQK